MIFIIPIHIYIDNNGVRHLYMSRFIFVKQMRRNDVLLKIILGFFRHYTGKETFSDVN